MSSFAELRAKAEAAANSAKATANSKLAAYRGDERPAKPVYKPPPRRPAVKPDIPFATRPRTPDEDMDTETGADDTTAENEADLSPEIQALVKNKVLFFEFLDEYFADHGYSTHEDVDLATPTKIGPQGDEEEAEAGDESHPPQLNSPNIAQIEETAGQDNTSPPPLPPPGPRQRARPPVPRSSLPPTPEAHDCKTPEGKAPALATEIVSPPSHPIISPAPAPNAPEAMYSPRKEQPLPATPPTGPLLASTTEAKTKVKKENRFSKILKFTATRSGSTPSTSTSSASLAPSGSPPPPAPSVPTKPSVSDTTLSTNTRGIPPPTFSSDASGGEFDYMPRTGRKAAENECSAARFVQYFHHNVKWDLWYTADDANARPPSLVGAIEGRWRGSVVGSQETKRRLFSEKTGAMEWVRVGYVLFQDHSMAWYRVMWKEGDPVGSLQREARWRPQPTPWKGERLFAAHAHYGQAIADFCERAVRTGQFVGRGEPWDMANGAIQALAKYKPHAPPVVPPIGHCHGHLIYEGFISQGEGWGSTRGGDNAVRAGDILEWCDAELQAIDMIGNTFTLHVGASGFTSVIVSTFEFPDRLEEDQHTLPPYRLPPVDIIEQSARNGMVPSKRTVSFETMTKGRIWVFRPVPWDYLGSQAEPAAEWPPPEPTRAI